MEDAKALRRHTAAHDLFHRLHSIAADEAFVRRAVSWFPGAEAIPNQRCGNWYCDPTQTSARYAYFKSTDGHIHVWDFNLRRSNLGLATHAEEVGGVILVDSTRRGKRMPDALSKTVPIWCAVINAALGLSTDVFLPAFISPSERAQIEARIPAWAARLRASALPLPRLARPLRPFFVHPGTRVPPVVEGDWTPVVCLCASRSVGDGDDVPAVTRLGPGRTVGFEYVPGAGDDDELWGRGLTPALFHAHKDRLLAADREGLPALVDDLVAASTAGPTPSRQSGDLVPTSVSPRFALALGPPTHPLPAETIDHVLVVAEPVKKPPFVVGDTIHLPSAKVSPTDFSFALREIAAHVATLNGRVLLRPAPGVGPKDVLALALALICAVPGLDEDPVARHTKATIAERLQKLVSLWPEGNPPRAALKRINEFLMSPAR
ncbi:tRNA A64-2'-O-ribosylphosphate transferase [Cryptotrichosporon argae]